MLGHEPIVSLRKRGVSVQNVFITENDVCSDWDKPGERYGQVWEMDCPTVCIYPDEPLERLDLRFSVGTVVHITSGTEVRAKQLLEAFRVYANTVVSSSVVQANGKSFFNTEYFELWQQS